MGSKPDPLTALCRRSSRSPEVSSSTSKFQNQSGLKPDQVDLDPVSHASSDLTVFIHKNFKLTSHLSGHEILTKRSRGSKAGDWIMRG